MKNKGYIVFGLVALIVSTAVYAEPYHNYDKGHPTIPDLFESKNAAQVTTSLETGNTIQAVNTVKGANFNVNAAHYNKLIQCATPLVDKLSPQGFNQIVAAIQNLFFLQISKVIQGPTGPQTVYEDTDMVRLTKFCINNSGVTQLAGGGALYRWLTFFMSGQWQGQTPGVCYTRNLPEILLRLQEYHQLGIVGVPQEIQNLYNLDQNDPNFGTMSCMKKYCTTVETFETNAYCPRNGYPY